MASGDRQVSVKIKAAFDTAFNATFQTADERIKGMNASLRGLKSTASELQSLKKTREEVTRLTAAISDQKKELAEVAVKRKVAADQLSVFEKREREAIDRHQKTGKVLKERQAAFHAEQEKLDATPEPGREQIQTVNRLKREMNAAKAAQAEARAEMIQSTRAAQDHRRQMTEAGTSVEGYTKKQKELTGTLKSNESQLKQSEERAQKYGETLRKARVDVDQLEKGEARLNQTLERRASALHHSERFRRYGERASDLRSQAGGHAIAAAVTGAAFIYPLREAIIFEKQMVRVKAMAGANAQEFRLLKDDARRLGAATVYSAIQVAQAQNELATAGFRSNEIIGIMPHMLDLATSSMTGLARTAEITSAVMQGFGLDVTQMKRIGDALTAAYSSSASSLETLGEMLKYVAPVATVAGASLESVLAASSVLHNNGIIGSMAGTTMRSFFLRLSDPPRETLKMLTQMNIKIKDGAGNMRDYKAILHDINRALEGVGTAGQARAWKKIAGEEAAPGVAKVAAAEKSGMLQLEEKKYLLAPAFNELGDLLAKMPEAKLQELGKRFGARFNRAMSGGGMIMSLSESLNGLKGKAFDTQLQTIMQEVGFAPKAADIKAGEYRKEGKGVDKALKDLGINPLKALGGEKSSEEMTREIKAAIQTKPMDEQLRFIEIFFSKTRTGLQGLFQEFSASGKNKGQLVQALGETLNMEQTRKALSESSANDLENIKGDFSDMALSLGEALIPMLKEFTTWLKPITEGLADWLKKNQGLAKGIMLTIGFMAAFSASMAIAKFALSGFIDILKFGDRYVFGKNRWGRKLASSAWDKVKAGGSVLKKTGLRIPGIQKLLTYAPLIRSSFGMIMNVVRAAGMALLTTPIGWIITALGVAAFLMWRNWATVGPALSKVWDRIVLSFKNMWVQIAHIVKVGWDWIKEHLSWHPVVYMIKNWEKLIDLFKWVYEKVKPYIKAIFPTSDTDIKISGPDEKPGFFSGLFDSAGKGATDAKDFLVGLFDSPTKDISTEAPDLPGAARAGSGSFVQRNVITVNAEIKVDAGLNAPREVASRIKAEIQTAFRNTPSFDLFDLPVVS